MKIRSLIISKVPITIFSKKGAENIDYDNFIQFMEMKSVDFLSKLNKEAIWLEETNEGKLRLAELDKEEESYREKILFTHSKRQVRVGYDKQSGKCDLQINYTKSNYIQIDFECNTTVVYLDFIINLVKFFDAKIFIGGNEQVQTDDLLGLLS